MVYGRSGFALLGYYGFSLFCESRNPKPGAGRPGNTTVLANKNFPFGSKNANLSQIRYLKSNISECQVLKVTWIYEMYLKGVLHTAIALLTTPKASHRVATFLPISRHFRKRVRENPANCEERVRDMVSCEGPQIPATQ